MRNIWTIAKREYTHYFQSPLAYIIALVILGFIGFFFAAVIASIMNNPFGGGYPDSWIVFNLMGLLLLFASPAITMRLLADENRMGTMELLLTAPVRDWELVVGKWFGSFLFILTILAVTLIHQALINAMVTPGIDQPLMLSGYLGIILVAAAFLAIGVAISSMFNNQFAAFFLTFAVLLFFWWLIGIPGQILPTGGELFTYLDMSSRYNSLQSGVINLSDIVYFLSVTALGLCVGSVSIEMRRWR
jgi:ABC-2 type transport system permease protein